MKVVMRHKKTNEPFLVAFDNSPETLKAIQNIKKSKTRKKVRGVWVVYKGKVFVYKNGTVFITTKTSKDEIINFIRQDKPFFISNTMMNYSTVRATGNPGKLISPKTIPKNAIMIPMNDEVLYLQITKEAVLYTNGIFFSVEDIGEVEKDNLFIIKNNSIWQIWWRQNIVFFDGKRLWDSTIPLNLLEEKLPNFISAYQREVLVDGDNVYKVYNYYPWRQKFEERKTINKRMFDRIKVSVDGKILYYPRKALCVGEWCP